MSHTDSPTVMPHRTVTSLGDAQTQRIGAALARGLPTDPPSRALRVYLQGELGAGKTTLVRGLLRALGVTGSVKSPSYSLLESYACPPWRVLHLDFYRLSDPQEVLALGLADHDERHTLWLVEWPERGESMLPAADLIVRLSGAASAHRLAFEAHGSVGESWLRRVSQEPEFSDAEH
ncbi:MAG: tRNA ((37)-N6)-threonylcarbamoyltransferase complex ATPase subunit type 1 TsaE [Pseudomonadota bacterium]|jgi:tRNA threonylcarbamoyladenosine biosynthesis protein TsaE